MDFDQDEHAKLGAVMLEFLTIAAPVAIMAAVRPVQHLTHWVRLWLRHRYGT